MAKDPVCGMNVKEDSSIKTIYGGKEYYFCSSGCKVEFEKNPGKYLNNDSNMRHHKGNNHSC